MSIERVDNGSATSLVSSSPTVPSEEWLIVDFYFGMKELKLVLSNLDGTEIDSISVNDENYGYDGLYYQLRLSSANGGGEWSYVDQIQRNPL